MDEGQSYLAADTFYLDVHTREPFDALELYGRTWSGKHNTISCPAGHHYYEGRWLHNPKFLDDYSVFWLRKGGAPRRKSTVLQSDGSKQDTG